jgi:hypothetical protein
MRIAVAWNKAFFDTIIRRCRQMMVLTVVTKRIVDLLGVQFAQALAVAGTVLMFLCAVLLVATTESVAPSRCLVPLDQRGNRPATYAGATIRPLAAIVDDMPSRAPPTFQANRGLTRLWALFQS